jgi:hypothetical protein
VFWFNAVLPSKTFGIRFDVENEGSLDAKVGVIKFFQVAASPGFNSLNFSCGATAEFATSKFKSVVVKPDGKFKTVVVKGLRAPATPGWRTLAGALDAGGRPRSSVCCPACADVHVSCACAVPPFVGAILL